VEPTSKTIRALQAQHHTVDQEIRALLAVCNGQNRNLTAEEANELAPLRLQSKELLAQIYSERARIQREISDEPDAELAGDSGKEPQLIRRHGMQQQYSGRRYRDLFPKAAMSSDSFGSIGELMQVVRSGLADPRLIQAAAGGGEGTGTDGGFMVPTQFSADLLDASLEQEIVRPRALVRPMEYNSAYVSGFNTQDHSASIGGFSGVWQAEGTKFTAQKGLIRALVLTAQKLGVFAAATNELLSDSPFYENELRNILIKAIGWYLDLAFLTGTGAGQPKGVLSDSALIVVNKESGQATGTLQWLNFAGMYERLHPACVNNAAWVINQGCRKALLQLLQPVTNVAGQSMTSWIPALRDGANGGFELLGLPVFFTEKVPAFSSQGDVLLADFSQYVVGLRKEMTFDKSQHLYFDSDETAFRAILRADGRGRWSQAVQPKAGATLSWCVTLQAR
jgi:HK97 family phage major capsid protein